MEVTKRGRGIYSSPAQRAVTAVLLLFMHCCGTDGFSNSRDEWRSDKYRRV